MRKRPASTHNVMHNAFLNKFVSFECVSLEIDQTNASKKQLQNLDDMITEVLNHRRKKVEG